MKMRDQDFLKPALMSFWHNDLWNSPDPVTTK